MGQRIKEIHSSIAGSKLPHSEGIDKRVVHMDGVWMYNRKREDVLNKGSRPETPNWPNVQEIPCCSHNWRWGEVIAHEGRLGQGKNSIYEIARTWSCGGVRSSNHFSQWGNAVRLGVWLEEIAWGGKGKLPISYPWVRPASPEAGGRADGHACILSYTHTPEVLHG